MKIASIVLQVPLPDEATDEDAEALLTAIKRSGFSMDVVQAMHTIKVYAPIAGVSLDGITRALLRGQGIKS